MRGDIATAEVTVTVAPEPEIDRRSGGIGERG